MSIPREITNNDDIIDSRDVIERIELLRDSFEPGDPEEGGYIALVDLERNAENVTDEWNDGATLIRRNHFDEYAKEYVTQAYSESVGSIPEWVVIDWEETANNLKVDYNEIEFGGITYYVR